MILTVLLTILKILGIIILSLLGLILLLLIVILFVPIRYKANFKRTGVDNDPPIEATAVISWLFHILNIKVSYSTGVIVCVRIFGIPVYKIPNNKKKKTNTKNKNQFKKNTSIEDESDISNSPDIVDDSFVLDDDLSKEDEFKIDSESINNEDESLDDKTDKIKLSEKITSLFKKLKCTITNAYDIVIGVLKGSKEKISQAKNNIEYYHKIITSDLFDRTFSKTKRKIIKLLKSIFPKYLDISVELGFDDPSTTGQVLAIYSSLYVILYKHIHIYGNFDENIIRGNGKLHGRIFIFSFIKIILYYLTDKDLKKLLFLLKKEGKTNGRK